MELVPSTDGVVLAVHDLGGSGPALLCSHATGFHGHCWVPMAAALADRYHTWALDYRAHGHSTRPVDGALAWPGFGEDATAAVNHLGLRGSFAFGHSMGGAALLMAELAQPGTFSAIALFEPIVMPALPIEPGRTSSLAPGARRRRAEFESRAAAAANYSGKPPLDVLTPEALKAYVEWGFVDLAGGGVRLRCEPEDEAAVYEGAGGDSIFDRLGEIGCPVLVLAGPDEALQPSAWAPSIAEAITGATFERHDEMGHFGPMQAPDALAERADAFFRFHR